MKVVFVVACLFIGVHCGLLKDIVSGDKSDEKKDNSVLTKVVYEVDDKTTALVETLKDTFNLNEKKDKDKPIKPINKTKGEAEKEKETVKPKTDNADQSPKPTDENNELNKKKSTPDVKKEENDNVPDDKKGDNKVKETKDAKEVTHSNGKHGTESSTSPTIDNRKCEDNKNGTCTNQGSSTVETERRMLFNADACPQGYGRADDGTCQMEA